MKPATLPGRPTRRVLTALVTLLLLLNPALAHEPGLSTLSVGLHPEHTQVALGFAASDVALLLRPPGLSNADTAPSPIDSLAPLALSLLSDSVARTPVESEITTDETGGVLITLHYEAAPSGTLELTSALLDRLPRGHRQHCVVTNQSGAVLVNTLLHPGNSLVRIELNEPSHSPSRSSATVFFLSGVEHILIGYDHLCFLFGLLMVGTGFKGAVKIITSFTLAHSITLALATFKLIHLPAAIVEPLIAASIVYVGVENLFRKDLEKRWILTFIFGLIHRCGFASVLAESNIMAGASGIAIPLLAFNLGVELGQVAVAAVVLPLVWIVMSRPRIHLRWVPIGSTLLIAVGGFWLLERLL